MRDKELKRLEKPDDYDNQANLRANAKNEKSEKTGFFDKLKNVFSGKKVAADGYDKDVLKEVANNQSATQVLAEKKNVEGFEKSIGVKNLDEEELQQARSLLTLEKFDPESIKLLFKQQESLQELLKRKTTDDYEKKLAA
jgi:hypothetical protein